MTSIIVIVIIFCFVFLVYKNKHKQKSLKDNDFSIIELVFVSSSISFLLYLSFFHFADFIWSFNIKIPPERFTPPARAFSYEHDGIEGYVLYSLMFVNIILSVIFIQVILRIKNRLIYLFIFLIIAFISAFYFIKIGFIPPMSNTINYQKVNAELFVAALIVTGLLSLIHNYLSQKLFLLLVIALLLPVCFISTDMLSVFDYSFILSPALRIVNGAPLSEIYFQYDLFLSLLAALWMKLDIDLNLFQILGQISFFLLFIGVFIFSKKIFSNKKFPIFILVSLLIVRYYAIMDEPVALFQATPLRLDLWLILLVLVYYKGTYHWINAVVIGILLMVHKNFGLLYLLSYYQLVFTLFVIELIELIINQKINWNVLKSFFKKHLFLNIKNFLVISGFVIASIILFKGFIPKSALFYQQIGVGMIEISIKSFYWYIPIMFSLCFILLLKYRNELSVKYFHSGLLLIFFSIGNSIYFFGRSHEHNILNISTGLILLLFLLFDLLGKSSSVVPEIVLKQKTIKKNQHSLELESLKFRKMVISVLPVLFVAGASYFYSEKVAAKIKTQYKNFKKSQFIYPLTVPTDFSSLKKITNNSDKVYFLNYKDDFLYYYYGKYKPVGYFNPCATWLLKDDMINFLQKLLEQNYYIVTTDLPQMAELLPEISYNSVASENDYTAISKDSVELLLPEISNNLLAHIGIKGDLRNNGIILPPIDLKENFVIEFIVKPLAEHLANTNIMTNAVIDSIGPSGITIQQNGLNQNQFLFAYGGGKSWSSPATFMLRANEWNYIVISFKKNMIKVFNNGQMVYSDKPTFTINNTNVPLTIGKGIGQNNSFNGLIKEVKIMNDSISEQTIMQTMNNIKAKLN